MRQILLGLMLILGFSAKAQDWQEVCTASGTVSALQSFEGELFIGGSFFDIDDQNSMWFGRWDGSSMIYNQREYGGGGFRAMAVCQGELYGFGHLDIGLSKWNGSSWVSVDPLGESGAALYTDGDTLFYGSDFGKLRKYHSKDGFSTIPNPEGKAKIGSVIKYKGELIVTGDLGKFGGIAVLRNGKWEKLSEGLDLSNTIYTMEVFKDELYVAGTFTKENGVPGDGIVKWDGSKWSDVGGSFTNQSGSGVSDLLAYGNELYVAGSFSKMGDVETFGVVKWNGSKWDDCRFMEIESSYPNALGIYKGQLVVGMFNFYEAGVFSKQLSNNIGETDKPNLSLFPQPANDILHLNLASELNGKTTIKILDMKGQLVYEELYKGEPLNTANFIPGIYVLAIYSQSDSHQIITRKLSIYR